MIRLDLNIVFAIFPSKYVFFTHIPKHARLKYRTRADNYMNTQTTFYCKAVSLRANTWTIIVWVELESCSTPATSETQRAGLFLTSSYKPQTKAADKIPSKWILGSTCKLFYYLPFPLSRIHLLSSNSIDYIQWWHWFEYYWLKCE